MNKIKLAVTGCLGRMGQQIIKSSKLDKKFKLVTLTENRKVNRKISGIKPELNDDDDSYTPATFLGRVGDDLNLSQALGVRQAIKEFSDENNIEYEIVHERFAKFDFN